METVNNVLHECRLLNSKSRRANKMAKIYGFETFDEALYYAEKNYYRNTYKIIETNSGRFAIDKIKES